jgi:hypothetical protein
MSGTEKGAGRDIGQRASKETADPPVQWLWRWGWCVRVWRLTKVTDLLGGYRGELSFIKPLSDTVLG